MAFYYSDDQITLHHGDALAVARELPAGAADCIVTSPPFYGLRDYGVDGQYGLEASPAEYVETMRALFAELPRVLADDGTLWLNLGDSYGGGGIARLTGKWPDKRDPDDRTNGRRRTFTMAKQMLGIPWRTAFALQDDGWILRNDIIWRKPNTVPESVTDRLSKRHEHVFLFAQRQKYWFDLDPIREAYSADPPSRRDSGNTNKPNSVDRTNYPPGVNPQSCKAATGSAHTWKDRSGRNPGDVWEISTQPFPGAHFAVMPVQLAQLCILAGCAPRRCAECGHVPEPIIEKGDLVTTWPGQHNLLTQIDAGTRNPDGAYSELDFKGGQGGHAFPRRERTTTGWTDCGHNAYQAGVVLDPFSGSGTTGLAALRTGRRYIGIDLNSEYLDLSLQTRLRDMPLDFESDA
jgi:DNA modification methylase